MPDYDLGSARGKISIDADTSGADHAAASMAAVSAEGKTLQETLGKSGSSMSDYEQQTNKTGSAVSDLYNKQEGLRQRLQEVGDASNDLRKAQGDLNDTLLDVGSTTEQVQQKYNTLGNAQRAYADATRNAEAAQRALRGELDKTEQVFTKLDQKRLLKIDTKGAEENLENTRTRVEKLRDSLGSAQNAVDAFSRQLGKFVEVESSAKAIHTLVSSFEELRKVALIGLGGSGAGGFLGLLGGGGAEGFTAIVGSMSELVGLVGLLPGLLAGAGAAAGTLFVGLHGVTQALASMDNGQKFLQAIREMAPAAQNALLQVQSFYSSFKGAMDEVQQNLFAPILGDIKPLVDDYLPMLMRGGQDIANVFGQAGHLFAAWLQTPATMQTIQQFLGSVTQGMQAALPAVQAFSNAFLTISSVGGGFFKEIGDSVAKMANEFNSFISGATQSGALQSFIQTGITSFGVLTHNVKEFADAFANIFVIGNQFSGGFLNMFKNIGDELANWTRSQQGQNSIADFFRTVSQAGQELHPILRLVGSSLATIGSTLVHLGAGSTEGITNFFSGLSSALKVLGPALVQSAPAVNIFLTAIGQLLSNVAANLGPALPQFFQSFAEAAERLVGPATTLSGVLATLFEHLTPAEVISISEMVLAFKEAGKIIPIVSGAIGALNLIMDANPIGIVVIAIGALVAGLVLAYQNSQTFRDAVQSVWQELQKLPGQLETIADDIGNFFSHLWDSAFQAGKNIVTQLINGMMSMLDSIGNVASTIAGAIASHFPHSPAETGPLSGRGDPTAMGSNISSGIATGIGSGQDKVASAASGVAGSIVAPFSSVQRQAGDIGGAAAGNQAQGISGGGLTSAGVGISAGGGAVLAGGGGVGTGGTGAGTGGGGFVTGSGFMGWAQALQGDLSAWSQIFHGAFDTFSSFAKLALQSVDVVARLWNHGQNALTAPGGIDAGAKPFIPAVGGEAGQQTVPGVPQLGPGGRLTGTPPAAPGALGPPSSGGEDPRWRVPPSAASGTPIQTPASGSGGTLAAALQAQGFSPQQIRLIQGFSQVEGNNPAGNPTLGFTDSQLGGASDLQSHVNALAQQFKDRAGVAGPFPQNGSDQDQAQWIANVVGQAGVSKDWQGNAQPKDYVQRVITAMQGFQAAGSGPGAAPRTGQNATGNWDAIIQGFRDRGELPAAGQEQVQPRAGGIGGAIQNWLFGPPHVIPQIPLATGTATTSQGEPGSGPSGSAVSNPASRASSLGGAASTYTPAFVQGAGLQPLYRPGSQVDYGQPGLPPWVYQLSKQFGVQASTYPEGGTLHQAGFAMDFRGSQEQMNTFANYVANNLAGQTLQLIFQNAQGQKIGVAGGQRVGPGTSAPGYFGTDFPEHQDHVHWATDVAPIFAADNAKVLPGAAQSPAPGQHATGSEQGWSRFFDLAKKNGLVDEQGHVQSTTIPRPGTTAGAPQSAGQPLPGFGPQTGAQGAPGAGIAGAPPPGQGQGLLPGAQQQSGLFPQQNVPGVPQQAGTGGGGQNQVAQGMQALQGAGNVASSIFASIDSVIKSIGAAADLTKTIAMLPKNTEDIVHMIQDIQQFITTAAQIAQTTSQVLGVAAQFAGMGSAAGPFGGEAAGALSAASAVAGLVSDALSAVNMGISTGIQIYHEVGKYAADLFGFTLGGGMTGWLGGNVQMLLNTNTGQLYTYSADNPLAKNTLNPGFQQAYQHTNANQTLQYNQMNVYAGPGQSTHDMMSDTMWTVQTSPGTISAAGRK